MSKWHSLVDLWRRARVWLGFKATNQEEIQGSVGKEFPVSDMTGFLATLEPEQKEKALAYRGPENHGDPQYESEKSGRYAFKRDILDKLDGAFDILRLVRKHDIMAYRRTVALGIPFQGPNAVYDYSGELPPSWKNDNSLPLFGAWAGIWADEKDKICPQFFYFTKYEHGPAHIEAFHGPVYELVALYSRRKDQPKWMKNGLPLRAFMGVKDGKATLLKEWTTKKITVPAKRSRKEGRRGKKGSGMQWTQRSLSYPAWTNIIQKDRAMANIQEMFAVTATVNEMVNCDIQVRAHKSGMTGLFAIDLLRIPKFFDDRDEIVGKDGAKKKIFHIVRTHARQLGEKTTYVKSHFRGERRFTWNGYQITISVPGKHHKSMADGASFGARWCEADEAVPKGYSEMEPVLERVGKELRTGAKAA